MVTDLKTILIVDDERLNINVLVNGLEGKYTTLVAKNGKQALRRAQEQPRPDLILLDIMMPEMDGFEVCKRLKKNKKTEDIPVIFITALSDMENEMAGLELGAVDYITKPFRMPIVEARINTHLALKQAHDNIQELLNNTLSGIIRTLVEIISLSQPLAFRRALTLRRHMQHMIKKLQLSGGWRYESAAMLSQLGCVTFPKDLLEKIADGKGISLEEREIFDNHPAIGAKLLANIPRLDQVAQMVKCQISTAKTAKDKNTDKNVEDSSPQEAEQLGGTLLRTLVYYERRITQGALQEQVLDEMDNNPELYPPKLMKLFKEVVPEQDLSQQTQQPIAINELQEGMILAQDIITSDGVVFMRKGDEVSLQAKIFLKNAELMERISGRVMISGTVDKEACRV